MVVASVRIASDFVPGLGRRILTCVGLLFAMCSYCAAVKQQGCATLAEVLGQSPAARAAVLVSLLSRAVCGLAVSACAVCLSVHVSRRGDAVVGHAVIGW